MWYLSGESLGEAPALSANIKVGWKGLVGTNTLAYYENWTKKFYNIGPFQKLFLKIGKFYKEVTLIADTPPE